MNAEGHFKLYHINIEIETQLCLIHKQSVLEFETGIQRQDNTK